MAELKRATPDAKFVRAVKRVARRLVGWSVGAWVKFSGWPALQRSHSLPAPVYITLTSYPPRYGTLYLTLKSLLTQSVRPDAVLLWIAEGDLGQLPKRVLALQSRGLRILSCEDHRSFKKIIPALRHFPEAFLATADDDLYYRPNWLAGLVSEHKPADPAILCYLAMPPLGDAQGKPLPFLQWRLPRGAEPPNGLLPLSGAGTLFPPRTLHPITTDADRYLRLCPTADDLWLYWMARMAGTPVRRVGNVTLRQMISWPASKSTALYHYNVFGGGNDLQAANLARELGFPPGSAPSPP